MVFDTKRKNYMHITEDVFPRGDRRQSQVAYIYSGGKRSGVEADNLDIYALNVVGPPDIYAPS